MGNVNGIAVGKDVKLKPGIAQMLDPLDFVMSVVDKPLIKQGRLLKTSGHHVGLQNALLETGEARILSAPR